jgi:hypothetical protein
LPDGFCSPGMNAICVDLLRFIVIFTSFAQWSILMLVWSLLEAIAGSSCVAHIAVPFAKVQVVVLSDVQRSLVLLRYRTGY